MEDDKKELLLHIFECLMMTAIGTFIIILAGE
jgi:hypothetical protein